MTPEKTSKPVNAKKLYVTNPTTETHSIRIAKYDLNSSISARPKPAKEAKLDDCLTV
jgi:hypothetical protein